VFRVIFSVILLRLEIETGLVEQEWWILQQELWLGLKVCMDWNGETGASYRSASSKSSSKQVNILELPGL